MPPCDEAVTIPESSIYDYLAAEEAAAAAGTEPDAAARLLRAGIAVGLVAVDPSGRFTLTEPGSRLAPGAGSVENIAGYWLAPIRNAMDGLADHVRSGRRVNPAAPGGIWDYLGSHPAETVKFSRAMGYSTSRLLADMTAAGYRPPSARRSSPMRGAIRSTRPGGCPARDPACITAAPDHDRDPKENPWNCEPSAPP